MSSDAGLTAYLNNALSLVEKYKDHPAIMGWYGVDEPSNNNLSVSTIEKIYDDIKAIDPHHLIMAVHNDLETDDQYINGVDLFGVEPYPIVDVTNDPAGHILSVFWII